MDLSPYQPWINLVHVIGVMAFILVRGASGLMALRIRNDMEAVRHAVGVQSVQAERKKRAAPAPASDEELESIVR